MGTGGLCESLGERRKPNRGYGLMMGGGGIQPSGHHETFPGFILKRKTFLKIRSDTSCVMLYYFKREQNLLTDSI